LVGPKTKGWQKLSYDKFTDTTSVLSYGHYHAPMAGSPARFSLYGVFKGKDYTGDARILLAFETEQMGEGGAIIGRKDGHQLSPSMAKYQDLEAIYLLLDDSARVRAEVVERRAQMKKAGALLPEKLVERLVAVLSLEDLAQIARASRIEFKVGDLQARAGDKTADSAKELVRFLVCPAQLQ
jgi:hypothetical protein